MEHNSKQEIISKISKSEQELKILDIIIKNLKKQQKNQDKFSIEEENRKLEMEYISNQEDIKNFEEEIKKLNQNYIENKKEINMLKNENENLQKNNLNNLNMDIKSEKMKNNNIKLIHSIKDLNESLDFFLFKSNCNINNNDINDNNEKDEINDKDNTNKEDNINNIINIEELQKNKSKYEVDFNNIKEKCNQFYQDIEKQKEIINNFKNYLSEINQEINSFNEQLSISNINNKINNNKSNKNLDKINEQIDIVSLNIIKLDEINFDIKNIFNKNIKNLLNEISNNFKLINNNKYKNNINLKIILNNIEHKIEEIQNICFIFEENKNNFNNNNNNTEKEVNKLKNLYNKYKNESKNIKKKNEKKKKIIINDDGNIININPNINNYIDNNNDNISLKDSFLFEIKENKNIIDLYKSKILFKNNDNEEDIEQNFGRAKILRKNWHEICYIYDDYDIHDIYYDIKALGLKNNFCFNTCSQGFFYDKIIEIQSFSINNVKSNFTYKKHVMEFKINLYNLDEARIHIIYKEMKDLTKISKEAIELRKIYRNENYGLDRKLKGQKAKFILILRTSFVLVDFDNYFLIKNEKNIKDTEYFWGGEVPQGGMTTNIILSKKESIWSFYISSKLLSDKNIRDTIYKVPVEFIGGNNTILNINISSPQAKKIILDEVNHEYIIKYKNTKSKEVELIIKGELKNKCKGEWLVDLTDREIEERMPKDDVLCKSQLSSIAKKIIEEFDEAHKNSTFKFLDYMKIGMWVNKNIKYNLKYLGKTDFSSIDIYNMRKGVCYHFTKLTNALLYSLGYKVIFVNGYICEDKIEFNVDSSSHAWSLIKLGDKWYPFDSTWGIFSGKFPVGHIFGTFFDSTRETEGIDDIKIEDEKINGKFIS